MERMSAKKRENWLRQGRDDFKLAYNAESIWRPEALDDLRFSFGDQWDEDIRQEREQQNRPCETFDRLGDMIRKGMRQLRLSRPSIKVLPVEDADDETAEIYTDLIREIEYASGGSGPYLWAAETAMRCGYGVWEVCEHDSDTDVWNQDLRIRRAANPFLYYFDPNSRHPVKADARFAIKSCYYTEEEFKAKWPNASVGADVSSGVLGESRELWYADGMVRVSKHWKRVPVMKTLVALSDGRVVYEDDLTEEDSDLTVVQSREVQTFEVWRWLQSGMDFLERPQKWPGRFIPCIPVYGEEANIEGQVSYRGLTRTAKGPQRAYNFARTTQLEIIAQQPKAPWLVGLSQVTERVRGYWARANDAKLPYLPYDDSKNGAAPLRQAPPVPSQGFFQEAMQSADDIQRATGIYDAALGAPSQEVSGRAILARQMGGDDGVMVFADNLSASVEQTGRILIDLIPHYYDAERVIRLRGEDDGQREVEVNAPELRFDPRTGEIEKIVKNDLTRGKYDVRVITGPGYKTRQLEAADSMMQFLQAVPAAFPFVADLVAKSQQWPNAEEFAERLKAMVPPGVLDEDDPEKQAAQIRQMQMQMQMLAQQMQGMQAKTRKDQATAVKYMAEARETIADTEHTRQEIELRARGVDI